MTRGCAWGDYDNDGNVDLLITNQGASNKLYHNNGDGSFSTVSGGSVSTEGGDSFGCAWGDYDRDGKLDLFVGSESAVKSFLYRNSGGGLFTNILFPTRYPRGCTWRDYDNDGDPDLILNAIGNQIWLNDGAGSLSPLSVPSFEDLDQNNFSLAWGDYDNDGNLDVFVAKVGRPDNLLLRNKGDGTFDSTNPMNNSRDAGYSIGGVFGDYDNDGFLDLFVINQGRRNFLYHNNGDGSFTKIITGSLANDIAFSRACSWADFDNDGFLDLFVANDGGNFCYRNTGNSNSWITIKCIGTASNRSAFGTKVKVKALINKRVRWQVREIAGGDGLSSQDILDAHFGLGDATVVDTVRIEWPSGIVQELHDVRAKQFLTVVEPAFQITKPQSGAEGFQMTVVARKGTKQSIEVASDLVNWTPLATVTNLDGAAKFLDSSAHDLPQRFYRVVEQ